MSHELPVRNFVDTAAASQAQRFAMFMLSSLPDIVMESKSLTPIRDLVVNKTRFSIALLG